MKRHIILLTLISLLSTADNKSKVVGLRNLGNSCYINSALQVLYHTKALKEYFQQHAGFEQNTIGYIFKEFLDEYSKAEKVYSPKEIHGHIKRISNKSWANGQPNDASEFLSYFFLEQLNAALGNDEVNELFKIETSYKMYHKKCSLYGFDEQVPYYILPMKIDKPHEIGRNKLKDSTTKLLEESESDNPIEELSSSKNTQISSGKKQNTVSSTTNQEIKPANTVEDNVLTKTENNQKRDCLCCSCCCDFNEREKNKVETTNDSTTQTNSQKTSIKIKKTDNELIKNKKKQNNIKKRYSFNIIDLFEAYVKSEDMEMQCDYMYQTEEMQQGGQIFSTSKYLLIANTDQQDGPYAGSVTVEIPMQLDISKYVFGADELNGSFKYNLYACIRRHGFHYTSVVKDQGQWFICDDDNITQAKNPIAQDTKGIDILSYELGKDAYIFCYERVDEPN